MNTNEHESENGMPTGTSAQVLFGVAIFLLGPLLFVMALGTPEQWVPIMMVVAAVLLGSILVQRK